MSTVTGATEEKDDTLLTTKTTTATTRTMNNETLEEDWSEYLGPSWHLSQSGFEQHEMQTFEVEGNRCIEIACVESLSPLDMMNLCTGVHDATGHRVWLGAHYFVKLLLFGEIKKNDDKGHNNSIFLDCKSLFYRKKVLELGCGVGFAGIALLLECHQRNLLPESLLLSDSDRSVLDLCEANVARNAKRHNMILPDGSVQMRQLVWGQEQSTAKGNDSDDDHFHGRSNHSMDTIYATDVIYDIDAVQQIFVTVNAWLTMEHHGLFLLSHVPRAACDSIQQHEHSHLNVERFIVNVAVDHGFQLERVIRPKDVFPVDQQKHDKLVETMMETGTSLFIFCRAKQSHNSQTRATTTRSLVENIASFLPSSLVPLVATPKFEIVCASESLCTTHPWMRSYVNALWDKEFGPGRHELEYFSSSTRTTILPQSLFVLETATSPKNRANLVGAVRIVERASATEKPLTQERMEALKKMGVPETAISFMLARQGGKILDESSSAKEAAAVVSVSIEGLVVQPTHRGRGLGKSLGICAVAWCAERGIANVHAHAMSERLLEWYARMGAKLDRENTEYKSKAMKSLQIPMDDLLGRLLEENLIRLGLPDHLSFRFEYR